jgi:hypothetical protein
VFISVIDLHNPASSSGLGKKIASAKTASFDIFAIEALPSVIALADVFLVKILSNLLNCLFIIIFSYYCPKMSP